MIAVGASNDPKKYGYRVFSFLKAKGKDVVPVNLREKEIQGVRAYHALQDIKGKIDLVVPPADAMEVLAEGVKEVWFQPGSESDVAMHFYPLWGNAL